MILIFPPPGRQGRTTPKSMNLISSTLARRQSESCDQCASSSAGPVSFMNEITMYDIGNFGIARASFSTVTRHWCGASPPESATV